MFGSSRGNDRSGINHLETVVDYITNNIPDFKPQTFMMTASTNEASVGIKNSSVLNAYGTKTITKNEMYNIASNISYPDFDKLASPTELSKFLQQKLGDDIVQYVVYEAPPLVGLEKTFAESINHAADLPKFDFRDETLHKSLSPDISDDDAERTHRLQCLKSNHMPVNGYAAFTKEDVDKLKAEGKKAILFIQDYDPKEHAELVTKVAGVVCLGKGGSHFLVKGIPAVTKAEQEIWNKETGAGIAICRIEEIDGKPAVVNNSHAVMRAVSEYLHDPSKPPEPKYSEKQKIVLFKVGDKVTLARNAAYQGNLYIEQPYLKPIIQTVDKLGADITFKIPKFLANAAASAEFNEGGNVVARAQGNGAEGIGLVRTENMLEPEALKSIKEGIINNDRSKFACLNELDAINGVLISSFSGHESMEPQQVRIRLFDFPPDEAFSKDELAKLKSRVGDDIQGTSLALKTDGLYEEQLKAIFKKARREDYPEQPVIEIMAPHIRTAEEMAKVRTMAEKAAEEVGYPHEGFKIGAMIETKAACDPEEAKKIAKLCDFASFGTNDLTHEITGIPRNYTGEGINPYQTLDKQVKETMSTATKALREGNPNITLSCCGGQMGDLDSLLFCAKELKLEEVSVPPTAMNLIGRRLQVMQAIAREQGTEVAGSTAQGVDLQTAKNHSIS